MAVFTYMHTICVSSPNPSSVAVFIFFLLFFSLSLKLITAFDWTRTWNQLVLLLFCCDTSTFWWLFFPTSPLTAFGRANDFDIVICINSCLMWLKCLFYFSFVLFFGCFFVVFWLCFESQAIQETNVYKHFKSNFIRFSCTSVLYKKNAVSKQIFWTNGLLFKYALNFKSF